MTKPEKDKTWEHHVIYAGSQNGRKTIRRSGSLLPTLLPKYYHNTLPGYEQERYIRTLIHVLSLVIRDQFILQIQLSTLVTILVQLVCT